MTVTPTGRRTGARRARSTSPIVDRFQQWLFLKNQNAQTAERQDNLRREILDFVEANGETDDKGNVWFDLPSPISFTDYKGKVFQYGTLKKERHLIPAQPQPDPEKSLELLKRKGLWLSDAQLAAIKKAQRSCPYVKINVEVDTDAVSLAYFKDQINEAEYNSILGEQRESYQFRPGEIA